MRRTGDTVRIPGGYQHEALTRGNRVQRFWHRAKQLAIRRYLPPEPGDRVIDVGCGSGVVSAYLGEFGAEVLGVDGNRDAVRYATEHFASENVRFVLGHVDETFAAAGSADKVYCLEVIEHIYREQAEAMLRGFHRLLRPGGRVFLTTPNYRSLWPLIERLMDLAGVAPRLVADQHVAQYNARSLAALAGRCGFAVERVATNCLAAPWLAVFGRRLAERVDALEARLPLPAGSILVCVLHREP